MNQNAMKKIIFIAAVILIAIALVGIFYLNQPGSEPMVEPDNLAAACQNNQGTWLAEFNECEHVSKEWCKQNGGEFNECESACRHNPGAEICTLQCVLVCKFNSTGQKANSGPENTSYTVENEAVNFKNGVAEKITLPDSGTKTVTRIFEANTQGDINKDGRQDAVVILTQDASGTGIFYYVAAALNLENGYQGTNAILLGDRIAPQTTQIKDDIVIINYADRRVGEPMTASPSIGVSKYLSLDNGNLREIPNKNNLIVVDSPAIAQLITSPLTVSGQARGNWFFEASFPITLTDLDSKIIAESHATAQGDWMTENFVDFTGSLTFKKPAGIKRGVLIFKKDNPSGLPEHDDSLAIPVFFE